MSAERVIVIHPSSDVRDTLTSMLEANGCQVQAFADLASAETELVHTDVVVCDINLPAATNEPIGDYLRARMLPRSAVLGVFEHADACAADTIAAGYFDDFASMTCGQAVMNVRIVNWLRAHEHNAAASLRRRDAEALLDLSQMLSANLDVSTILHLSSGLVAKALEADRCAIVLLDGESGEGVIVAASEDKQIRDQHIDIQGYPEMQSLLATSAPVVIEDAATHPLVAEVRGLLAEKKIGSELLYPIVLEGSVVGALFLRSVDTIDVFDDRQLKFGMTVASQLAIAIRNARLFDSFRTHTKRVNIMRLQAEQRMRALEHYEDFFEYAADGMAVIDDLGTVLYLNREGERILGYAWEQARDVLFGDMLSVEACEGLRHMQDAIRQGQHCRNVDLSLMRPQGEERSLSVSASPLGEDHELAVLSFRDVTELREMQTELKTTKDFLENLIDSSVDGIIAADLRGRVLLFNKGAEHIYGLRASDVIGRIPVWQLYPSGEAQKIMEQLRNEAHGGIGRLVQRPTTIVGHGRNSIPVNLTASIIYEDGEEVATVGIFSDMRERLQIQADLDEAQRRLIQTERAAAVAELAGAAAHELNQPLTSIVGYAEMLRRKIKEGEPARRSVDIIYREAERMAVLVRKIGRITKYETKNYGGSASIVDLERSTTPDSADSNHANRLVTQEKRK